jgi:2-oxoglutarate dehydrogenase E2 component (dihydrolipoamide succinyltransferase)
MTRIKDEKTSLSPAVKYLIKKYNIDISKIEGTGTGGRVTATNIEQYLSKTPDAKKVTHTNNNQPSQSPIPNKRIPHSRMRKLIADHMVDSMLRTAPHVTAVFDADMSAIITHREKEKKKFEKKGVKLTFTAYFVRAVVQALKEVPEVNSCWHEDELEIFTDHNIGIATALDDGLIVPVIQKAQKMDLFKTASTLLDLTTRTRSGKLKPDEVQSGTFTITNHGVSGSLIATPIINQPQSAILGIGKMEKRVIVVEKNGKETTEIKPMVYVTLTIDHRVLDGFKANQFLTEFVNTLEKWRS